MSRARRGARVFGRVDERVRRVRGMDFTARRVVTGLDAEGQAIIRSDGPPEGTIRTNGFGVATWLWLDGPPATVEDGGDEPEGSIRLEPPVGGCSVRIIRFPAASEGGGDWIRVEGDDPDEPGMHATDTLDFMVVVDGRIVLGLDDGEHELGAGDVVIQRGNRHRWRVVGDDPCTYVVCMLRPDPDAPAPAEPQQAASSTTAEGPRRLVAATDEHGRSYVLSDGTPPCSIGGGGTALVELWQTGGALGAPDQGGDPEGDVGAGTTRWRESASGPWSTHPGSTPVRRGGTPPRPSTSTSCSPAGSSCLSPPALLSRGIRSCSVRARPSCSAAPTTGGARSATNRSSGPRSCFLFDDGRRLTGHVAC